MIVHSDQKIKEKTDDNTKLEAIQKAKAERAQMGAALKGTDKSLTLRITVETAPDTANPCFFLNNLYI